MTFGMKQAILVIVVAAGLAGCASTQDFSALGDIKTIAEKKEGVAVLQVNWNALCGPSTLLLARREPQYGWWRPLSKDGLFSGQVADDKRMAAGFLEERATAIPLSEGEYGIVRASCTVGRVTHIRSARSIERRTPGQPTETLYTSVIASFTVKTGEVVDVGRLNFVDIEVGRSWFLNIPKYEFVGRVDQITPKARERFREEAPHFADRMVTRPMERPGAIAAPPPSGPASTSRPAAQVGRT